MTACFDSRRTLPYRSSAFREQCQACARRPAAKQKEAVSKISEGREIVLSMLAFIGTGGHCSAGIRGNIAVQIVIGTERFSGNPANLLFSRKAPEGWRSPRRFAYFNNHHVTHSVLECGGPPPLFHGAISNCANVNRTCSRRRVIALRREN